MPEYDGLYVIPSSADEAYRILIRYQIQQLVKLDSQNAMMRRMLEVMVSRGMLPVESMQYILNGYENHKEVGSDEQG